MIYKQNSCKNCGTIYTYFDFGANVLESTYCPRCVKAIEDALKSVKRRYEGRFMYDANINYEMLKHVLDHVNMTDAGYAPASLLVDDDNVDRVDKLINNYVEYRIFYMKDGTTKIMVKQEFDINKNEFTPNRYLSSKQNEFLHVRLARLNKNINNELYNIEPDEDADKL